MKEMEHTFCTYTSRFNIILEHIVFFIEMPVFPKIRFENTVNGKKGCSLGPLSSYVPNDQPPLWKSLSGRKAKEKEGGKRSPFSCSSPPPPILAMKPQSTRLRLFFFPPTSEREKSPASPKHQAETRQSFLLYAKSTVGWLIRSEI